MRNMLLFFNILLLFLILIALIFIKNDARKIALILEKWSQVDEVEMMYVEY